MLTQFAVRTVTQRAATPPLTPLAQHLAVTAKSEQSTCAV